VRRQPTIEACVLLTMQSMLAVISDRADEAKRLADAVAVTARSVGEPAAGGCALLARGWTMGGGSRPAEMRSFIEQALTLTAQSPECVFLRGFMLLALRSSALQLGDRGAYEDARARLAEDPNSLGHAHVIAQLQICDAAMALNEGRLAAAQSLLDELSGGEDRSMWHRRTSAYLALALAMERDRPDEIERARSAYGSHQPSPVTLDAISAALAARAGDMDGSQSHAQSVRRQRPLARLGPAGPTVLRHLAEVAARTGDTALAADLLAILRPYTAQLLTSTEGYAVEAAADRAIGQVLFALRRYDEAVTRLRAGAALESAFGAAALAAHTTVWHARALKSRNRGNDGDVARRLLRQTAAEAARLGLAQLGRDVADARVTHDRRR
jgi:tetratricopeptide (TPR) repeat protein